MINFPDWNLVWNVALGYIIAEGAFVILVAAFRK